MKLNQVFTSIAAGKKLQAAPKTASTKPMVNSTASTLAATTTTHKSGKFFEDIEAKLKQEGPAMCTKVNAVIGFQIACEGDKTISYYVDLKNKPGKVGVNDGSVKPACTVFISDENLLNILAGKLI